MDQGRKGVEERVGGRTGRRSRGALSPYWGLLVVAALVGSLLASQPVAGQSETETVRYRITLTGLFDADALASGTAVPSGAGFSGLVGGVHNTRVTFWGRGVAASAGLEELAETGNFRAFRGEVDAAKEYNGARASFRSSWGSLSATGEDSMTFETTAVHPLVTVVARIAPSPDWFVGVRDLSLRADGDWISSQTIDLYPWDAGTEDGSGFESDNSATSPQGTVTRLRNSGPFSDDPIARLTISLEVPQKVRNVSTTPGDGTLTVHWRATTGAASYKVQWRSGDETFETAESDGRQHVVEGGQRTSYAIPDLENGTKYRVRVIATNVGGDGRPSAQVKGSPEAQAPGEVLVANIHQDPALNHQFPLSASTPQYLQAFTTGAEGADLGAITLPNLRGVQPGARSSASASFPRAAEPAARCCTPSKGRRRWRRVSTPPSRPRPVRRSRSRRTRPTSSRSITSPDRCHSSSRSRTPRIRAALRDGHWPISACPGINPRRPSRHVTSPRRCKW